jgi:hypothetical protein
VNDGESLSHRDWFIQFFLGQGATQEEAEQYADENILLLEQLFSGGATEGP